MRNDLVKRFEETTKQEIINHNKAIESSNGSLRDIDGKIKDFKLQINNIHKSLTNYCITNDSKWIDYHNKINGLLQALDSKINDLNDFSKMIAGKHSKTDENYTDINTAILNISDKVARNWENIRYLQLCISNTNEDLAIGISSNLKVLLDEHRKLKEEIAVTPKEIDSLNDALSYRLDEHHVNYTCLRDEVEIVKRDVKHLQKNVESIQTVLEQIKIKLDMR